MTHIIITTGESRESLRSEVSAASIAVCRELINRIRDQGLQSKPIECFPMTGLPGYSLSGHISTECAVFNVWADGPPPELLFAIGVASGVECSAGVWRTLHDVTEWPTLTDRNTVPAVPWCAVVIEPAMTLHLDAAWWASDFQRCVAWAFWEDLQQPKN